MRRAEGSRVSSRRCIGCGPGRRPTRQTGLAFEPSVRSARAPVTRDRRRCTWRRALRARSARAALADRRPRARPFSHPRHASGTHQRPLRAQRSRPGGRRTAGPLQGSASGRGTRRWPRSNIFDFEWREDDEVVALQAYVFHDRAVELIPSEQSFLVVEDRRILLPRSTRISSPSIHRERRHRPITRGDLPRCGADEPPESPVLFREELAGRPVRLHAPPRIEYEQVAVPFQVELWIEHAVKLVSRVHSIPRTVLIAEIESVVMVVGPGRVPPRRERPPPPIARTREPPTRLRVPHPPVAVMTVGPGRGRSRS